MRLAKDLAVVGASALVVALVAGAFIRTAPAVADPDGRVPANFLKPGPVDAKGVVLTMDFEPETCRAGERLAATLRAVNRKDAAEERKIKILMYVRAPRSPMARVMPVPKLAWTNELTLDIEKGETKVIAVRPEIPIQEGESVTFSIEVDGRCSPLACYPAATGDPRLLPPLPKERS